MAKIYSNQLQGKFLVYPYKLLKQPISPWKYHNIQYPHENSKFFLLSPLIYLNFLFNYFRNEIDKYTLLHSLSRSPSQYTNFFLFLLLKPSGPCQIPWIFQSSNKILNLSHCFDSKSQIRPCKEKKREENKIDPPIMASCCQYLVQAKLTIKYSCNIGIALSSLIMWLTLQKHITRRQKDKYKEQYKLRCKDSDTGHLPIGLCSRNQYTKIIIQWGNWLF